MFYTLSTKFLIKGSNADRDYFYIFLAGSVGYICLHWYLHMDNREGIVGCAKEYLYYVMVVDAIIAYIWTKFYLPDTERTTPKEENSDEPRQYTPDEKRALLARMQEAKRLQQSQNRIRDPTEQDAKQPINYDHGSERKSIFSKKDIVSDDPKICHDKKMEIEYPKPDPKRSDPNRSGLKRSDPDPDPKRSDPKRSDPKRSDPKRSEEDHNDKVIADDKVTDKVDNDEVDDTDIPVYKSESK